MKKKILSVYSVVLLLYSLLLMNCKFDKDFPLPLSYISVYMPQALEKPNVHNFEIEDTVQTIIFGANGDGGTGSPDVDLQVYFMVDTSLVEKFNTENSTNYPALPRGSYELATETAVISKGNLGAKPLKIKIKTKGFLQVSKSYLLPVRIYKVDKGGTGNQMMEIDEEKSITFFLIQIIEHPFTADIIWSVPSGQSVRLPNNGTAPSIDDNGNIYFITSFGAAPNTNRSELYGVGDLGNRAKIKWSTEIGASCRNAASIGPDGNLYIGLWTGDPFYKIDKSNGNVLWIADETDRGVLNNTCAIDDEGNIYVGTRDGSSNSGFYSFKDDGMERWRYNGSGISSIYVSPALSRDGKTVYTQDVHQKFFALNTADGSLKWMITTSNITNNAKWSSLSVGEDGTIYMTSATDIFAIQDLGDKGSIKWKTSIQADASQSGIVIGPDGTLYTGSTQGLISLNPDGGAINWIYDNVKIVQCVPAVDKHGNVYFGTTDGNLCVVNSAGKLVKKFSLGNAAVGSPIIADNGDVFVEVYNDDKIFLYKIAVENGGPAGSSWPMKGQNRKLTAKPRS